MRNKWIQVQTQTGETLQVQGLTITPRAQVLLLRWPNGGFVWNRATAVDVTDDEATTRFPIIDVTRLLLLLLLLLPILLTGIVTLINWFSNQRRNEWIRI